MACLPIYLQYIVHIHHFCVLLCFYECSPNPLHLHSFPTRRSSDLIVFARHIAARAFLACTAARRSTSCSRSVEHTSELQSRGHLVCRLLLEKKNLLIQFKPCAL